MPNDTARQKNGHTRPKRFYGNPLPEEILISVSSSNGKRHVIHRERKSRE